MKIFCSDWPYLIRNHLSFSVSVFCSQMITLKLNLRPNIGLTYVMSIVKWFFLNFCRRKYFLLFFAEFELLMFHNNTVKVWENKKKAKLLTTYFQVTYPTHFCIIAFTFTMGKVQIFDIFKNQWLDLCVCTDSYDKWFCIKSWHTFANLLLLYKAPSKKRLSERCRMHSRIVITLM